MSENGSSKKQRRTSSRGYKPTREESGTSRKIGVTAKQRRRAVALSVSLSAQRTCRGHEALCA